MITVKCSTIVEKPTEEVWQEDGSELREQLLALSDVEQSFSYCLLDTPIPLLNYVAHVRLFPVTDTDSTFWEWEGKFNTIDEREDELREMVANDIYLAGFNAIKAHLQGNSQGDGHRISQPNGNGDKQ